jgi:allantoinase
VIWNPDKTFTVQAEDILHRHTISPYIGEELNGVVIQTIINAVTTFKDARIHEKSKHNGEPILANNYII